MYFLQQIKRQFIYTLASYQSIEGAGSVEDLSLTGAEEERGDTEGLGREADELVDRMGGINRELSEEAAALQAGRESPEGTLESVSDIAPLSSQEALSQMEIRESEETRAREILGEDASIEDIREHVFTSRVEQLNSNSITAGEIQVIESEFINQIAGEAGINPELIGDLRALGFEGAQDWEAGDVASNLESMTQDLQRMRELVEADGGKFPETKEEFLALYEAMHQNDNGEPENTEMDPAAAAANGVDAIRDPDGGFQINPETPGYSRVGDMVAGPAGAPYSRGGQVYSGSGEISTQVNSNLDTAYSGLRENSPNPLSADQVAALRNPENKEIIENRIPAEWHGSAIKMENKIGNINPSYPIMLASMTEKRGLVCYPDGKVDEFPIIIGRGGYREGAHSGGATTPTYEVFNFSMSTRVTDIGVDASNGGSSTVLGASIQSPEGASSGGKWWHGVADNRIPGGATLGCIGAKQENMMMAARAVLSAGGGYGFHSDSKTA